MNTTNTVSLSLQERLEAEFCPPLDTSLVAALIMELDISDSSTDKPSDDQVRQLRETLGMLAQQAEKDDASLAESLLDMHISSQSTSTDDTESRFDSWCDTTSCSSTSTPPDATSPSPLGFLQAAFPRISAKKLRKALDSFDSDDVDMEGVVEALLNEEHIRELKERGLTDQDETDEDVWDALIKKSNRLPKKESKPKRKKPQVERITIVDIRQRHNMPASANGNRLATDPWTQIDSLSTHLAGLLLGHPPTFFASYFHSPAHATPAVALRNALVAICQQSNSKSEEDIKLLYGLLDVVCSSGDYEALDPDGRSQLTADAQLCLNATHGRSEHALDLVWLLRDLDKDFASLRLQMGPYHSPPPKSPVMSPRQSSVWLPLNSPSIQETNMNMSRPLLSPVPSVSSFTAAQKIPPKPAINSAQTSWTVVQPKPSKPRQLHTHAEFIPAYNPNNVPRGKIKGVGNAAGKGGKGDVGELGDARKISSPMGRFNYRSRLSETMKKRDEALREAGRHWQRGHTGSRGGEIAFYFAERARELQEKSRQLSLNAAREMVETKRMQHEGQDIVDLHGTTISEAVTIVKEVLAEGWVSPSRALKVITGRGLHSINRVGVLGPAVKKSIEEDGWIVSKWDGGFIVRGKR